MRGMMLAGEGPSGARVGREKVVRQEKKAGHNGVKQSTRGMVV